MTRGGGQGGALLEVTRFHPNMRRNLQVWLRPQEKSRLQNGQALDLTGGDLNLAILHRVRVKESMVKRKGKQGERQ